MARYGSDHLVFIGHSSKDRWVARQTAAIIEPRAKRHGVRIFPDEVELAGGDRIPDEIRRQAESCREFLVLLTPLSIARQWVLIELGAAWGLRKRLTAITDKLADAELPDIIRQTKAYDLNEFDGASLS